jgi:hypothetical protein
VLGRYWAGTILALREPHSKRKVLCLRPLRPWRGASCHHHYAAAGILPAVEGGILPPGPASPSRANDPSAGQDARLYGRQDARRYSGGWWLCKDAPVLDCCQRGQQLLTILPLCIVV